MGPSIFLSTQNRNNTRPHLEAVSASGASCGALEVGVTQRTNLRECVLRNWDVYLWFKVYGQKVVDGRDRGEDLVDRSKLKIFKFHFMELLTVD